MEFPLVSIIVPMYNAAGCIARCVKSICAQSYKSIEIILLNDGSKDGTLSVCRALAAQDHRIALVDKPNSGAADTRNQGLALAHGRYVQFVDSDDWLAPDFTEKLVTAAETHAADLVIAPFWMVYPKDYVEHIRPWEKALGTVLRRNPPRTRAYGYLPAGVYTGQEYARQLIEKPNTFYYGVLWNKLYRREIIAQNQLGFAPEIHWAEDLIFNMCYLEYAQVFVSISTAGYHYIQNPQSLCHTQIGLLDIVENKTQIFQLFKEVYTRLGLYDEMAAKIYRYLFAFSESISPSNSLQGAFMDVMAHLSDTADQSKTSTQKSQKEPKKSQSKSKKSQQEPKKLWRKTE